MTQDNEPVGDPVINAAETAIDATEQTAPADGIEKTAIEVPADGVTREVTIVGADTVVVHDDDEIDRTAQMGQSLKLTTEQGDAVGIVLPVGEAGGYTPWGIHLHMDAARATALSRLVNGLARIGVQLSHPSDAIAWLLDQINAAK